MASRIFDVECADSNASVVIAGSGPFLLAVASHLVQRGVLVQAVVEYHSPYRIRLSSLAIIFFPTRVWELVKFRWTLMRKRVPVIQNSRVERVSRHGSKLLAKVRSNSKDDPMEIEADYVAVAYGFTPMTDLAVSFDLKTQSTGHAVTVRCDSKGVSSKDWIYVVGESQEIRGWRAAQITGRIAGLDIVRRQGRLSLNGRLKLRLDRLRLRYEVVFTWIRKRSFSETAGFTFTPENETLICRCEGITYRDATRYADQPWSTASALKAETRIGMGTCQGKLCGYALAELTRKLDTNIAEFSTSPRVPMRPIAISALVKLHSDTYLADQ